MKKAGESNSSGTSLSRALGVLDMVSLQRPLLSIDDITSHLGYTRSTAYRYLKELCDAGLMAAVAGGSYSLGPRIIELERLAALTDPLYRAGRMVLQKQDSERAPLLLLSLYGDKVLCIYMVGPESVEHLGERITVQRARGLPLPLFRGAGALVLLAYLSPHRIRETYLHNAGAIAAAGLGDSWDEFRANMALIRRKGYATSLGHLTSVLSGVAVPIIVPDNRVVGSLARTYSPAAMPTIEHDACAEDLARISAEIAAEYMEIAQLGVPDHNSSGDAAS